MTESRRLINDYQQHTLAGGIERANLMNTSSYFRLTRVADFFEDLGYAGLRSKYLNMEDIVREFGATATYYQRLYAKHIEDARKREANGEQDTGIEPVYENFTNLVDEIGTQKGYLMKRSGLANGGTLLRRPSFNRRRRCWWPRMFSGLSGGGLSLSLKLGGSRRTHHLGHLLLSLIYSAAAKKSSGTHVVC